MNWNNIHTIQGQDFCVAYACLTSGLSVISKKVYDALNLLKKGISIQNVLEAYPLEDKESLSSIIRSLEETLNVDIPQCETSINNRRIIRRITVHVANDCNLRCKYCYAGGGNYGHARNLMTSATAERFVDFCIKEFDRVEKIVFFGGEPMLNVKVMELVCNRFKRYMQEGQIAELPIFVIITNGTILNSSILEFIKSNISFITVSIDGPKDINDVNRNFSDGMGSYEKISQFIHTLHRETQVKISYEATFTQSHLAAHYTYSDIAKALNDEFGINGAIAIENTFGLKSRYWLDYWNSVDKNYLKNTGFDYLPEDFWRILSAITHKEQHNFCSMIDRNFAVGADGNIFACQMLNGIEKCRLGNIEGVNIYNSPELYKPYDKKIKLKENDKCRLCWARNLCGGCAVQGFFEDNTNEFLPEPKQDFCELMKLSIDSILLLIASIRKDKELWAALLENRKKFFP